MKYLGGGNLFISDFVIGSVLSSNKQIECIKTLHDWLYFKDSDWGMDKYRTDRTQYVAFLHIIDLPVLEEIFKDFVNIYKESYPHGEKADFLEHVFSYTLYDLEKFIDDDYTFYGCPPNILNEIYYKLEIMGNEIIDFIIEPSKDIEQYRQYYKKVIKLINDLDFNNLDSQYPTTPPQQKETKTDNPLPEKLITFNKPETATNLHSYEIINETFTEITPLLKALPPQQTETEQEQPKTFDELFYNTNLISPCIEVLRKVTPALIDTECNYIGKSKGAFCIWMDEMQSQGIIKHYSDRKIYATLLCKKIKRFSIDESMFGKPYGKRAEENYRTDFKTLLSQIKLSHSSQKGNLGK